MDDEWRPISGMEGLYDVSRDGRVRSRARTDESRLFVNHKDGDKLNNSVSNLEWVTTAENNKHSFDAGLRSNAGEANAHAVLSQAQVQDIRFRLKQGETCVSIARDYPVTDRAISRIKRRKCWSHI